MLYCCSNHQAWAVLSTNLEGFYLGTGVLRHSDGGVGMFICMYVVRIIRNAHARVMEAENSIILLASFPGHIRKIEKGPGNTSV